MRRVWQTSGCVLAYHRPGYTRTPILPKVPRQREGKVNGRVIQTPENMNTNEQQLSPGAYKLPPDCKAFVRDGRVIVSKKWTTKRECKRCADCIHLGKGRITYYDQPNRSVCLARKKTNGRHNCYPKEYSSRQRYFAASPNDVACELFKSKQ